MNLIPFITTWAVLAVGVSALALYRVIAANHEDKYLHIGKAEAHLVDQQTKVFRKIESIDRWGKLLTVIAVVYGLALAGVYSYHVWLEGFKIRW